VSIASSVPITSKSDVPRTEGAIRTETGRPSPVSERSELAPRQLGSRGNPSTRSPMMLRSTFEVPPMIV
jgi:hypothetical protein